MIGREDSSYFGQRQRSWWIGKPWRRVELILFGEGEYHEWTVGFTLGSRRLGLCIHGSLNHSFSDYSEEPNQ